MHDRQLSLSYAHGFFPGKIGHSMQKQERIPVMQKRMMSLPALYCPLLVQQVAREAFPVWPTAFLSNLPMENLLLPPVIPDIAPNNAFLYLIPFQCALDMTGYRTLSSATPPRNAASPAAWYPGWIQRIAWLPHPYHCLYPRYSSQRLGFSISLPDFQRAIKARIFVPIARAESPCSSFSIWDWCKSDRLL